MDPDNADIALVLVLIALFVASCWLMFYDGVRALAGFVGCLVLMEVVKVRLGK